MSEATKFTPYLKDIKKRPEMISVQINLLNECTSNCQSCRRNKWPRGEAIDIDLLKSTLVKLRARGLETVLLSGGDPILYPDLEELVEYMKMMGLQYSIITTLITNNEDRLAFIAETATRIHVSVDASSAEEYAKVRGTNEKAFDIVKRNLKFIRGIRNRDEERPRISFTLSKLNYLEVGKMVEFAHDHNCNINFYFVHTWEDMMLSNEEKDAVVAQLFDAKTYMQINDVKIITNIDSIIEELMYGPFEVRPSNECIMCKIHAIIDFDGAIYPCCTLSDDNGDFDPTRKYAYGNIRNFEDFQKRFALEYPKNCDFCKECNPRYVPLNKEYEEFLKVQRGLFL